MVAAKKLPCGHLFHVHCLRSWLERQQTCPTCRSPVLAPEGRPPVGDGVAPPLQPPQHHQQPPRPSLVQGQFLRKRRLSFKISCAWYVFRYKNHHLIKCSGREGVPAENGMHGHQHGHTQGSTSPPGTFCISPEAARLQAAAAAAAQYNSSFVYPALNGRELIG